MIEPQTFDLMTVTTDPRAFGNEGALRLILTPDMISMEFAQRPPYQLRWDDPKLEFAVIDLRSSAKDGFSFRYRYPKGTPTLYALILGSPDPMLRSFSCPRPIWIAPAAYEALRTAALALGLLVYRGPTHHNAPSDATVWDFRRKKILLEAPLSTSTPA